MCFSFRDYISNRVQHVCDRQAQFVNAAKYIGARTSESNAKLIHTYQLSRNDQEGLSVLKSIQRQAEKSYELMQHILQDLERLEAALPVNERFFGSDSDAPEEFPCLAKMLGQRRRHSVPVSSPSSSTALRRQIAARKAGMPAFPTRSTSIASSQHSRSGSLASYTEPHHKQTRVSPYKLTVGMRQGPASASAYNRPYSKSPIDQRSQSSLHVTTTTTNSANSSAPASPISDCGHRVSFDGESIHNLETTSLSVLASHNGARSLQKRNTTGSGIPKRPASVLNGYIDPRSSHARGEVSLSTQQVLWSPQMSLGASESSFSNPRYGDSLPHLILAGVEEENGTSTDRVSDERSCAGSARNITPELPCDAATCDIVEYGENSERKPLPSNALYRNDRRAPVAVSPTHSTTTKGLQLLVPSNKGAVGATVSPKSLPRGLSMQANSSLESSPSSSSFVSPTAIVPPSMPGNMNPLSVVTPNDLRPPNMKSLSPQYPSEATRMLKQVIREHSDISSLDGESLSGHSSVHSHILDKPEPAMLTPEDVDAGSKRLTGIGNTMHHPRSRTSSLAHSQPSTVDETNGISDHIRSESPTTGIVDTTCSALEHRRVAEAPRGTASWSRTNTERLSTWSSSSAKTLSDGVYGSRISGIEDPSSRTAKQQLLTAAALSKLSIPTTVSNHRPPRSSSLSVSSSSFGETSAHSLSSQYTGNSRHRAHIRAKVDLGLSMRSDLERRVRSFSESEGNMVPSRDARPHSSMGFHETVSGAHVLRVRPDGIPARHNSPHSASLRLLRSDKFSSHRLSVASIGSSQSSNRKVSISSDRPGSSDSAMHGGVSNSSSSGRERERERTQSLASSYSSQATEPLPPTPPNSLDRPSSGTAATAVSTVTALAGKQRAQTMNQHYKQIKRAL
ncbi:hypothetical protein GGI23_000759 [Coemansia sp. RSA 2559]|nr:hypothetical protein GGI23_000759 [Coemansia sp. RSA 2559]